LSCIVFFTVCEIVRTPSETVSFYLFFSSSRLGFGPVPNLCAHFSGPPPPPLRLAQARWNFFSGLHFLSLRLNNESLHHPTSLFYQLCSFPPPFWEACTAYPFSPGSFRTFLPLSNLFFSWFPLVVPFFCFFFIFLHCNPPFFSFVLWADKSPIFPATPPCRTVDFSG